MPGSVTSRCQRRVAIGWPTRPSATAPAARIIPRLTAASQIGMRGRTAPGRAKIGTLIFQNSPSKRRPPPFCASKALFSSVTSSRMRAAGRSKRTSYQSSFMRRVAEPSPSTMRPPESSSMSMAALAWSSGVRVNAFAMAVPSRMREVCAASAASGT